MSQSVWAEIPASPRDAPPGRARRFVTRVVVPLAMAAVLVLLGLTIAAGVVVLAAVVLVVLSVASPPTLARVEHWLGRFGHVVGRVIGAVLLTIVDLLVFTPIAFVLWVFRYDPLSPGIGRDRPSFWLGHTGRALPSKQFTDERGLWAGVGEVRPRRRPALRLATVVGVLTLVLLADLGAGWLYDQVSSASHGSAAVASGGFDPSKQPALANQPWVPEVLAEQSSLPEIKDPYLGYRMTTKPSKYTDIVDGVRASYEPPVSGPKLKVWFFGASALFGDGQRDDHTIPSEVARLAEAAGIPVEVRNYGRPGVAMWQELELFEQVVSSGDKPDLVVFYDGFNDLAWQMNVRLSAVPQNIFDTSAGSTGAAETNADAAATAKQPPPAASSSDGGIGVSDVVSAYWDQAASHRVYDAIHDIFAGSPAQKVQFANGVPQRDTSAAAASADTLEAVHNSVGIQTRAASLATAIAEHAGAQASFFWQPSVFTKKLLPDEQAYLHLDGYEPARWDPAVRETRALLAKTPFVDLGNSLDSATAPVLWDFVHTNEEGARLAAVALFSHLEPQMRQRIREGRLSR